MNTLCRSFSTFSDSRVACSIASLKVSSFKSFRIAHSSVHISGRKLNLLPSPSLCWTRQPRRFGTCCKGSKGRKSRQKQLVEKAPGFHRRGACLFFTGRASTMALLTVGAKHAERNSVEELICCDMPVPFSHACIVPSFIVRACLPACRLQAGSGYCLVIPSFAAFSGGIL